MEFIFLIVGLIVGLFVMYLIQRGSQQSQDVQAALKTQKAELGQQYQMQLSKMREQQSQMETTYRTQKAESSQQYERQLSKMREQQGQMEMNFRTQQAELTKKYEIQLSQEREQQQEQIQLARKDSVNRSRSVLKGKVAEQMAPILPGFDYSPSDARFVGDPIDYLIFSGYTAVKDDKESGDHLEVVIADIKRGKSSLSKSQRAIARAVEAGRVRFEVMRVDDDGRIERRTWRSRSRRS